MRQLNRGVTVDIPAVTKIRFPIDEETGVRLHDKLSNHRLATIQGLPIALHQRIVLIFGEHILCDESLRIEIASRRMLFNRCVHHRLGDRRLVGLVMATTSVTHQIDDNVFLELISEINGKLRSKYDRFGVIAVYVENRRLNHFCNIGAVLG